MGGISACRDQRSRLYGLSWDGHDFRLDDGRPAATSRMCMEPNAPNDADLVAQALSGHREAFAELYDRHARLVRAVVAGVSGDWPAVEDMTQECFLRAYRNLGRLRDAGRFGAWIAGIARQVGRERRRTLRRDRHEFRQPEPGELATLADVEPGLHDREELELVMQEVARLPERERLAIHLFYFGEQDARQAAEMLGMSRSGFYALLQRALARLAARLRPSDIGERAKK
jgi:RNA polymerase sigma factor (sigma-70 family)